MGELATTVWPVALNVWPKTGESPHTFAERVCIEELPKLCGNVVPELWPVVLGEEVWDRLSARAREALLGCDECRADESFERVLANYDSAHGAAEKELTLRKPELLPRAWPLAGKGAGAPGAGRLLVVRPDGKVWFDGELLATPWPVKDLPRLDGERNAGDPPLATIPRPSPG